MIQAQLVAGYHLAYLAAYRNVMLVVAATCGAGAGVVWFGLPHRQRATLTVVEGH